LEKTFAITLVTIFLFFYFLIIRGLFRKGIFHFRLLKKLYPQRLKNVNSYLFFLVSSNIQKLDFNILIWFWFPIYYTKVSTDKLPEDAFELHLKLKQNNKQLGIIFICFIVVFLLCWIFLTKYGK